MTSAMPSDAKPSLTPKLRFPEFRDKPAWEETILGSVLNEHGETDDGASEVHSVSVHKGVINQVEHLGRSYAAANRSNYNLAKPHDVIYTKSPTGEFPWGVVKQNRLPYNVIVSPLYGVFSPVNQHLGYILDAYFESPIRTTNYLGPITQKGAKNTIQISNATFLSKGLYLPSSEAEHKKIAECLGTLDDLMGAESQKLDALKTHKKGLMQQLFPRAGETRPRLRFPRFQNAPEWEEVALGEIAEIKLGKMLDGKKHTTGRLLPYLNNISVRWNEVDTTNLPQMYFDDDELERFGLRAGDVVVCEGGEPGRAAVWDGRLPNLKFQKAIHRVRFNLPFVPHLLVQYLEAIAGTSQFEKLFTGGGIKHLTRETFALLKVPLISPAEQKQIAGCLSALEELIAAQSAKLAALQTHKQGLMQQLFPSPEEAAS
jgi:type I restriction enzyme, S subunit